MQLAGSVVLVTGASSGIGRAVAGRLGARGALVLASGRDPDAVREVARDCGGVGLVADLSLPERCADLAARAIAVHGRVDVLVASAGLGAAGAFEQMPPAAIVELVQVNLTAPVLLARELLPGMLARGRGQLVLIGSIAGLTGVADEAVYAATKAGLANFTESLRLECHGRGVGVSHVVPGVVRTAFFDRRGVPYGRRWPRPVDPDRIVRAVLAGIERGTDEAIVPKWLSLAPRVRALSPTGYRFLARRFGNN